MDWLVCQFSQSEQIGWIKAIRYTKWRSSHSIPLDGLTTLFQTYSKRISWWGQAIRPIPTGSQFFCLSWAHDRAALCLFIISNDVVIFCLNYRFGWWLLLHCLPGLDALDRADAYMPPWHFLHAEERDKKKLEQNIKRLDCVNWRNQMARTMSQLKQKKQTSDNTYKHNAWLRSVSWPYINWEAHTYPYVHHARPEVDRKEIHIRAWFSHPISNIHKYEIRGKLHYKDLHKHSWAAHGSFCMFFLSIHISLFLLLTQSVCTPPFCLQHMLPHYQNRDSSLQAATPLTSCHSVPTKT